MCYIWCDDGVTYAMSGVMTVWYMVCLVHRWCDIWYVWCDDGAVYGVNGVWIV